MRLQTIGQTLELVEASQLVSGSVDITVAEFVFDESWDGFTCTAVFESDTISEPRILIDNKCNTPANALQARGHLRIGVYGVKGNQRKPTIYADLGYIYQGAKLSEATQDPGPTVFDQIINELAAARLDTGKKADRAEKAAAASAEEHKLITGVVSEFDNTINDFNKNVTAKTGAFDKNSTGKTAEYNANHTAKVSAYNNNATAKTNAFDKNTALANDAIDKKVTAVNNLADGFNGVVNG